MQTLKKIMVASELSRVMEIPDNMQNLRVEVLLPSEFISQYKL